MALMVQPRCVCTIARWNSTVTARRATGNFNLRKGPSWTAVVPTSRNVGVAENNWLENNAVASFSEWTFAALAPTASLGTVTGRIVDSNGRPVEGAVVRLSGGSHRKFITDTNGHYQFDRRRHGRVLHRHTFARELQLQSVQSQLSVRW